MRIRHLAIALLPLMLAACGALLPPGAPPVDYVFAHDAPDLANVSHHAAATLVRGLSKDDYGPILVTSLVNVRDLERSSTFARVSSEQIATGLSNLGYPVIEARLAGALTVNKAGEHILSDEARELARSRKATSVVTGTYGFLGDKVFVSVRLVRLSDGLIISSADFEMPLERPNGDSPIKF